MPYGDYTPSAFVENSWLCKRCGSLVTHKDLHDGFHERLDLLERLAYLIGVS